MVISRHLAAMFALSAWACAHPAPLPPATPEIPLAAWELAPGSPEEPEPVAAPRRDARSPAALAKSEPVTGTRPELPGSLPSSPPARTAPSAIGGGAVCLTELSARGVRFARSEPVLGVATPVVIRGPLGGVRFYSHEKKPMIVDCRLALALDDLASDWRALGVSEARYSGAYVYRTSRAGRLSLHAYGLAIDLHEFKVHGESQTVKRDFTRGHGACGRNSPVMNALACRLRARGLFHEQIGPDDNADHHDHFHLGLRPLPGEVAEDLPWPSARSSRSTVKRSRSKRSVKAARK